MMGLQWPSSVTSSKDAVVLANGVQMPVLGLGTSWSNGSTAYDAVKCALEDASLRLIDTASRYQNETEVGKAIADSAVSREDIFLTTKLWPEHYGKEQTLQAFNRSCENLGVEYLDLYLMHWPGTYHDPEPPVSSLRDIRAETWRAMELLLESGKCRAIGVSNFLVRHLDTDKFLDDCTVVPHVNQVEYNPFQQPRKLQSFCRERNIQLEGYCPLAKGAALSHPVVVEAAHELQKTPAQVLIRWSLEHNVITIPKSGTRKRIIDNSAVFDFELPPAVKTSLDGCVSYNWRSSWNPERVP